MAKKYQDWGAQVRKLPFIDVIYGAVYPSSVIHTPLNFIFFRGCYVYLWAMINSFLLFNRCWIFLPLWGTEMNSHLIGRAFSTLHERNCVPISTMDFLTLLGNKSFRVPCRLHTRNFSCRLEQIGLSFLLQLNELRGAFQKNIQFCNCFKNDKISWLRYFHDWQMSCLFQ